MRYPGPDAAVLAYERAHNAASVPKTPSMGQAGREYARRCSNAKCRRSATRVRVVGKMGELVDRCSWCGSVWAWEESYTLAGQTQSGRGGRAPAVVERAGELAPVMAALDSTEELEAGFAEIYTSWLCVGSKTIDRVAEDATRIRFQGRTWERRDVRRAIAHSRRWLEATLRRRGLLALGGGER